MCRSQRVIVDITVFQMKAEVRRSEVRNSMLSRSLGKDIIV